MLLCALTCTVCAISVPIIFTNSVFLDGILTFKPSRKKNSVANAVNPTSISQSLNVTRFRQKTSIPKGKVKSKARK